MNRVSLKTGHILTSESGDLQTVRRLMIRNPDYHPPCRPYEMANLTLDIIQLARYLLVPKGRLVFFIPTITEDWDEVDLPVVEGMRELKIGTGSVQDFHSWGRRVSLVIVFLGNAS
jgi:hypothetical protein